jgi:serine endopeptidase inhibitor I10-like protein
MRDKTESSILESSESSLPFFARFLEGQDTSKGPAQTLKYPSDRDEWDQRVEYTSATTDNK